MRKTLLSDASSDSGEKNVSKKQRRQIEQKLDFYNEWLHHNSIELKENQSTFSEAISRVQSVLCDLAAVHADLANMAHSNQGSILDAD
jgi:hypothetical protein